MNEELPGSMRAVCACGTCAIDVRTAPTVRLNCHCTICQSFTGEAYSDVMVIPAYRAKIANEKLLSYKMYKRFRFPPPNIARGRCTVCRKPLVETWGFGLMHAVLFVSAARFAQPELLPKPKVHVFYEHRVADINDGAPKYTGYLASQFAIARMITQSILNLKEPYPAAC